MLVWANQSMFYFMSVHIEVISDNNQYIDICMYGPRKHKCRPFCGPEGRFDCSESVFSLRPAPHCYLCMRVRILCVLKNCLLYN